MHGTTIDRRSLLVRAIQKVWRSGRESPDYNAALGTTVHETIICFSTVTDCAIHKEAKPLHTSN